MKIIDAPGGIPTFVSLHECNLYEKITERLCKDDLNEREIYLIQSLVSKNLIKRVIENKKTYYQRTKGSL